MMKDKILVKGKIVDECTRCTHYHSPLDIIAIKFKCCNEYYPCFFCHEEEAGHAHQVWAKDEFDMEVVLCGVCKHEMTIQQYLQSNHQCPQCSSAFNPRCSNHYPYYFEETKAT